MQIRRVCFGRRNPIAPTHLMKIASRLFCLLAWIPISLCAEESKKPNILLIVGDDMGYADVGFHGCKDIATPHLDALAAAGARFTNGYVSGPYCSPTRAGLITGRYQNRFGHEFNPGNGGAGLPITEKTLAQRLKQAGYATGIVGKWHLGSDTGMHPQDRGFDEFFGFLGGAHSYFQSQGIIRGKTPVKGVDYLTDSFGREAVSFIERHEKQPWFLYLAFNAVHTPMDATPESLKKLEQIQDPTRRKYVAMMQSMDDAIGAVMKQLKDRKLDQNTLVCFISDNGGPVMPGVTINGSNNAPLRGSKRTTLEGGIRVPFLISWPGHVKAQVIEHPVIQLDLHATALAAAGAKTDDLIEGANLMPLLLGESSDKPHDALFWRFGEQKAVRVGDFKLVRYDLTAEAKQATRRPATSEWKLYNLREDIGESKDLAASMPEKVNELQALWQKWNEKNVPPLNSQEGKRRAKK